jgi:hypothetical protein
MGLDEAKAKELSRLSHVDLIAATKAGYVP